MPRRINRTRALQNKILRTLLAEHGGLTTEFQLRAALAEWDFPHSLAPQGWKFLRQMHQLNLIFARQEQDGRGEPADIVYLVEGGWRRLAHWQDWQVSYPETLADLVALTRALLYESEQGEPGEGRKQYGENLVGVTDIILEHLSLIRDFPVRGHLPTVVNNAAQVRSLLGLAQMGRLIHVRMLGTGLEVTLPRLPLPEDLDQLTTRVRNWTPGK